VEVWQCLSLSLANKYLEIINESSTSLLDKTLTLGSADKHEVVEVFIPVKASPIIQPDIKFVAHKVVYFIMVKLIFVR
jgi:hypothetical protein